MIIEIFTADVAPTVKIIASGTNPKENASLTLRCEVTGSPRPQRSWIINGRERKCRDLYQACVLTINTVEYPKDDGNYTCISKNLVSTVSKYVTVEVQGTETSI